mgnify:CR=1 FL=1
MNELNGKEKLKAFYDLMDKEGNDHNMFVQLKVNGEYQRVAVWELLHVAVSEAKKVAVEEAMKRLLEHEVEADRAGALLVVGKGYILKELEQSQDKISEEKGE